MKTVRIYGMAANLADAPSRIPFDCEVWCCNDPRRGHRQRRRGVMDEWTRWFNMHSERHMRGKYPDGFAWFGLQYHCVVRGQPVPHFRRRIVLQKQHADIPLSEAFPKDAVMAFHGGHRYYTCSVCWFMALAAYEGFEKVELYGFQISSHKAAYAYERPCFYFWVNELRRRGIVVEYPKVVDESGPIVIGDPNTYKGPLYGYDTT